MNDRSYLFPPPPTAALPVRGATALFPVRRIHCVGRNYAQHAREMGHDPTREAPFFFQKAPDSLVADGGVFPYPAGSSDVHHEVELVVALKLAGTDISENQALDHVFGYAVGLDMTRRDLQGAAKKAGRPWEVGKAFDHAAPCSALAPAASIGHPAKGAIRLNINETIRQQGDLSEMIWSVPEIIAHLSRLFELKAGDLIFTGTPAGVGPVQRGDRLHGTIDGVGELRITIG
ncbi:MAG TPA: fumarylacetoacetate hydrolase family protein [Dongiaceae bacterium]|nr:fumarylacetoacetate hydrolase family protein [Dongiaceae bacterium]